MTDLIHRLNDIADNWEDMGLALLARDFGDKAKEIVEKASPFNTIREAADEITRLRNSYRCYSCKQTFAEDHGHGLAREHFGSHLKGDIPKCTDILNGTATWGGGPHDPFLRIRKEQYDTMKNEIAELKARVAQQI